jgi:hypothetical protein
MTVRKPPSTASIALATDEVGKLHAPSAARNAADLCSAVQAIAPAQGDALELASGTGQHIVAFAAAMPGLYWQPTEVETTRLNSINVYARESGLSNIAPPFILNATQTGWSATIGPKNLISVTNLLHLISDPEAAILISEAGKALTLGGMLVLYGPFKRSGKFISDGDLNFDASIRSSDPEAGYKDDASVKFLAENAGLNLDQAVEMPANNLTLVFRKVS